MTPELREYYRALVEAAKSDIKRAKDESFNEEELVGALAERVSFDADHERKQKAQRIIDRLKRAGSTRTDGQLMLPGFNESFAYEPERLISDDLGNIIENSRAAPRFYAAEVGRAQANVEKAVVQLRRKTAIDRHFQQWALAQALDGRPALELIWSNCIAETGVHQPDVGEDAE